MAGGGGVPEGGNNGKKSVDFQLNLVPFIDLLSVLISFLLMTAVWTQVARIEVRQMPNQPSEEPPPEEEEQLNLSLLIKSSGYTVSAKNAVIKDIEKVGESYDLDALSEVLKQIKTEYQSNKDIIVTSEDTVPYQELITVMDLCLDLELDGISVAGLET
ncbi:MAG: ExbD/TolR family protein [Myxococcota bacterium]